MKADLILLLLLFVFSAQAKVSVIDGTGRRIILSKPAKRIVVLAPHALEMLYAIGAGDKVVATIEHADYPPAALRLPKVGSFSGISLDALLRQHPDLVVTWSYGSSPKTLQRLREMGIAVFVSNPLQLDDVAREMSALGSLTNRELSAQQAVNRFRSGLQNLRKTYSQRKAIRVFVQVSTRPIFTISAKSFLGQVVTLCGGNNVFSGLSVAAPQVSTEAVIRSKAQVIFTLAGINSINNWQNWPSIPAVSYKTIYKLSGDTIARPGPRLIEGARQMCQYIDLARDKLGLTSG